MSSKKIVLVMELSLRLH